MQKWSKFFLLVDEDLFGDISLPQHVYYSFSLFGEKLKKFFVLK